METADQAAQDAFDPVLQDELTFIADKMAASKDLEQELRRELEQREAVAAQSKDARKLPAFANRDELVAALGKFQVLIIVVATGSGKTTQIPQ